MKSIVIVTAFLVGMLFEGANLEKDTIVDDRMNIKSKTGEIKGYIKKDTINPNQINVYDKHGNRKGFLVRDSLKPDAWLFKKQK
ncbi:MAG: hypothetical protein JRJ57_01130 [Deltaproteobacteria bacterium]|nr:hypothetical protein [Deltaproteobacteria bacterium]